MGRLSTTRMALRTRKRNSQFNKMVSVKPLGLDIVSARANISSRDFGWREFAWRHVLLGAPEHPQVRGARQQLQAFRPPQTAASARLARPPIVVVVVQVVVVASRSSTVQPTTGTHVLDGHCPWR